MKRTRLFGVALVRFGSVWFALVRFALLLAAEFCTTNTRLKSLLLCVDRRLSLRAYERDAGADGDGAQSAEGGAAADDQDDQHAEPHVEEMD